MIQSKVNFGSPLWMTVWDRSNTHVQMNLGGSLIGGRKSYMDEEPTYLYTRRAIAIGNLLHRRNLTAGGTMRLHQLVINELAQHNYMITD